MEFLAIPAVLLGMWIVFYPQYLIIKWLLKKIFGGDE